MDDHDDMLGAFARMDHEQDRPVSPTPKPDNKDTAEARPTCAAENPPQKMEVVEPRKGEDDVSCVSSSSCGLPCISPSSSASMPEPA